MPFPRYERLDPEKRKRLLHAAAAEFANKGLEGASLNEILGAVGLGKSSYYYYFADKEDLFATVVEEAYKSVETQVPAPVFDVADADAFWSAVERHQHDWLHALSRDPYAPRLFRSMQLLRRTLGTRLEPTFARVRANQRAFVAAGRARGFVRGDLEVDLLVDLIEAADAALDADLYASSDEPNEAQIASHLRLALDTCRRLLAPVGPRTTRRKE